MVDDLQIKGDHLLVLVFRWMGKRMTSTFPMKSLVQFVKFGLIGVINSAISQVISILGVQDACREITL